MLKTINENPIGVIDSGIGGVHVLNALILKFPSEKFVYFADNKNMPYGNKTKSFIIRELSKIVCDLIARYHIKMLVLACNTASCVALEKLQNKFCIPIVGVRPDAFDTKTKCKLLVTTLTATTLVSTDFVEIESLGGLADDIESNINKPHNLKKILKKSIEVKDGESIALGCTHYQMVIHEIRAVHPNTVIIDPSQSVIFEAENILKKYNYLNLDSVGAVLITLSKPDKTKQKTIENLIKKGW